MNAGAPVLAKVLQEKMKHGADPGMAAALCGIPKEDIIDFSSNINPRGFTGEIRTAAGKSLENVMCYPEPFAGTLTALLAEKEHVPPEWILCGNGGADLIYRTALSMRVSSVFQERQHVLTTVPNFTEYREAFAAAGFQIRDYRLQAQRGFQADDSILREIRPELAALLLCNPNNPTGVTLSPELLRKIRRRCRELGVYLVLDECFMDFLEPGVRRSLEQKGEEGEKLLILKSFTKMFAIPALRAGWLICSERELRHTIRRLTPPWQISGPAQAAAIASLHVPEDCLDRWRRELKQERSRLRKALLSAGAAEITGEANYLFFRHPDKTLQVRLLLPPGPSILIRSCANYAGLDEYYYRAAVKSEAENRKFSEKLTEIGKKRNHD